MQRGRIMATFQLATFIASTIPNIYKNTPIHISGGKTTENNNKNIVVAIPNNGMK